MSAMKTALNAIDASSSKLLNTDTKSLLHSKFKEKEKAVFIPLNRSLSTNLKLTNAAVEMKCLKKTSEAVYSSSAFPFDTNQTLKIRTKSKKRITATRSAPTSPSFTKTPKMGAMTKKSTSDSEQQQGVDDMDLYELSSSMEE